MPANPPSKLTLQRPCALILHAKTAKATPTSDLEARQKGSGKAFPGTPPWTVYPSKKTFLLPLVKPEGDLQRLGIGFCEPDRSCSMAKTSRDFDSDGIGSPLLITASFWPPTSPSSAVKKSVGHPEAALTALLIWHLWH